MQDTTHSYSHTSNYCLSNKCPAPDYALIEDEIYAGGIHQKFIEKVQSEFADVDITVDIHTNIDTPFEHTDHDTSYIVKGKELDKVRQVIDYRDVVDIILRVEDDGSITADYHYDPHYSMSFTKSINYRAANHAPDLGVILKSLE